MEVQMVLPVQPLEMRTVQVQVVVQPVLPLEMHKVQVQVRLQLPSVQRRLGSLQQQVQQILKNQAPSASHIWPSLAPIQAGASSWVSPPQPTVNLPQPQTAMGRSSLKPPLQ